jgi:hypothetical protein
MNDQLAPNATLDRCEDHHAPRKHWDWAGPRHPDAFATAWALTNSCPSRELLTVASAALTWWESHQRDTMVINGQETLRYPSVPTFVAHARAVMQKVGRF